jgi:transcriptional regulator with XRE-family HTH domain
MGESQLAVGVTALDRWMDSRRVSGVSLAQRLGISPQYLRLVRRGEHRPSDELKWKIEDVTKAIEAEDGVTNPVGVAAISWLVREIG